MGMLDKIEPVIIDDVQSFSVAGDDYLTAYLEEIEQPKQEQPRPVLFDEQEDDEPFEINEDDEQEEDEPDTGPKYNPYQLEVSSKTAFFVVQKADQLISAGVAAYAHVNDPKEFEASNDEIAEVSEHLAIYFAENSMELPPWIMAMLPGIMIISKKFSVAGHLRKANIEKEAAEAETRELRRQIAKLKIEKEKSELEKEVNDLKPKE